MEDRQGREESDVSRAMELAAVPYTEWTTSRTTGQERSLGVLSAPEGLGVTPLGQASHGAKPLRKSETNTVVVRKSEATYPTLRMAAVKKSAAVKLAGVRCIIGRCSFGYQSG